MILKLHKTLQLGFIKGHHSTRYPKGFKLRINLKPCPVVTFFLIFAQHCTKQDALYYQGIVLATNISSKYEQINFTNITFPIASYLDQIILDSFSRAIMVFKWHLNPKPFNKNTTIKHKDETMNVECATHIPKALRNETIPFKNPNLKDSPY
jgi:hypothetical protein